MTNHTISGILDTSQIGQEAVLKYLSTMHLKKALGSIHDYFRGAMSEMKKVVWPTQTQTMQYSIAVIVMSIFVALFFGVLDLFFSELLGVLIAL